VLWTVVTGNGVVQVIMQQAASFTSFSYEQKKNVIDAGRLTLNTRLKLVQ